MKTLKNLFRNQNSEKSINSFSNSLSNSALLMIKGGTEPDEDLWPPIDEGDIIDEDDSDSSDTSTSTSSNTSTNTNT